MKKTERDEASSHQVMREIKRDKTFSHQVMKGN